LECHFANYPDSPNYPTFLNIELKPGEIAERVKNFFQQNAGDDSRGRTDCKYLLAFNRTWEYRVLMASSEFTSKCPRSPGGSADLTEKRILAAAELVFSRDGFQGLPHVKSLSKPASMR
jgi:hypothetical protein